MCWMPRLVTNTPSTRKWCIFWQEHALTACAASSDVFAWNWRVQILSEWRVARQFNAQELEYCTFESDVKYRFLFSKYSYWIKILMWRSRGPVRLICGYARFAKISHFRAPGAESRGPRATRSRILRCVLHLCPAKEPKKTSFYVFSEKLLNVPRLCPR